MKSRTLILLLIICGYACSPSGIQTSWRPVNQQRVTANKILIAVILPEQDSTLRRTLELQLSSDLNEIGYQAVAASQEFGKQGMAKLGQEQTYLALCENGIDAVVTLTVLDIVKSEDGLSGRIRGYSNIYYYDRIWNYKHAYKREPAIKQSKENALFMEAFLFDLKQLQPVYFSETRSFSASAPASLLQRHAAVIFNDMVKKKVLIPKARPRGA